jgi:translation initiation factor 6 (eIF-6)
MRYIIEEQITLSFRSNNIMADTKAAVATPVVENRNAWKFGFTTQAEVWNGRFAMIGFVAALATEAATNQGVLKFWGLL